ncbi:MAG TPA: hypothetical protein VLG44_01740 [Chlamydiales bacterium]|nr:hypothetical protein [Chlamydiales bacterium]
MKKRKQKSFFVLLFILLLGSLSAVSSNDTETTEEEGFNPYQIEVLRGRVVKVDSIRPMMRMILDTDREEIIVQLGPSWYFLKRHYILYPGDIVAVTGSRVTEDGITTFMAMEIKKGNYFIKLRDDKGNPVWGAQENIE